MLNATLDHVAIAVRSMRSGVALIVDALGASFLFGGDDQQQGFRWAQFRLPGGGKIELVTPTDPAGFLARFLDQRGEGVHHVTLKVADLRATIEHLTARGVTPVRVSLENPSWREAFIHPRDAHGTLIQLAQSPWTDEEMARHHLDDHADADHQHLTLAQLEAETGYIFPESPGA